MAIVNANQLNSGLIFSNMQQVLKNLREALNDVSNAYSWMSGISETDLTSAPINMPASDAIALLTAVNDAHALFLIQNTGLPPASYPQPTSAYLYAASQNAVIGPNAI